MLCGAGTGCCRGGCRCCCGRGVRGDVRWFRDVFWLDPLQLEAYHLEELFLYNYQGKYPLWRKPALIIQTRFDSRVHQPSIFLPLHPHSTRILPIAGMGLVHFMESSKTQKASSISDVLAQREPQALGTLDTSLAPSVRTFGVDVDRVDTRPAVDERNKKSEYFFLVEFFFMENADRKRVIGINIRTFCMA